MELRTIEKGKNDKLYDTDEMLPELIHSAGSQVDQKAVLRARLLDNFIMDFDRHDGQWLWMKNKIAEITTYSPVPKDRDQAFFKAEGILPKLITSNPPLGPLQGFKANAKNIHTFNYAVRDFDRSFLTALNQEDWKKEIDHFLSEMTDEVIEKAINKQPGEIQSYEAKKIIEKLNIISIYFPAFTFINELVISRTADKP